MSMTQLIISAVAALFVIAIIMFPEFRQKLLVWFRGGLNKFVEDRAKTPEGAKAIFTQAINEAEEKYQTAKETYNRLYGKQRRLQADVVKLEEEVKSAEVRADGFARRGDRENAKLYAERVVQLRSSIKSKQQAIATLTPSVEKAKQAYDACAKRVTNLKNQKQDVVAQMETNLMTKELMDSLDEVYKGSATDKMLDAVLEGAGVLMEESNGAVAVHESKTSTKIARAEQLAEEAESAAYLDEIMQRYNGGK